MQHNTLKEDSFYTIQKIFVLKALAAFTFVTTLGFGINGILRYHNIPLGSLLLFIASLSLLVYRNSGMQLEYRINILMIPLLFLMGYLTATGGIEGTGAIWIFIVPPVVLFLYSFRKGIMILSAYVLFMVLVYFTPLLQVIATNHYSPAFKIRAILAFVVSSSLTAVYAYAIQMLLEKLKKATRKLQMIAETDHLTEVFNRHGVLYQLKALEKRACSFSILLIDVDHFKSINDAHGHHTGDSVLKRIAEILKSHLREEDVVARWGGEEFLVLLPHTDKEEAVAIAEKLRQAVRDALFDGMPVIRVSISTGIAHSSETKCLESLIQLADARLYKAKEDGRDRSESEMVPCTEAK